MRRAVVVAVTTIAALAVGGLSMTRGQQRRDQSDVRGSTASALTVSTRFGPSSVAVKHALTMTVRGGVRLGTNTAVTSTIYRGSGACPAHSRQIPSRYAFAREYFIADFSVRRTFRPKRRGAYRACWFVEAVAGRGRRPTHTSPVLWASSFAITSR